MHFSIAESSIYGVQHFELYTLFQSKYLNDFWYTIRKTLNPNPKPLTSGTIRGQNKHIELRSNWMHWRKNSFTTTGRHTFPQNYVKYSKSILCRAVHLSTWLLGIASGPHVHPGYKFHAHHEVPVPENRELNWIHTHAWKLYHKLPTSFNSHNKRQSSRIS